MVSGKSTFFVCFPKVPEYLLVAFKLLEIHWAAFFPLFYASFSRENVCKNPGSLARMQCFAAFTVETNKRFLLFFIQHEISKTCRRENLCFLHTFSLENEAEKSGEKNAAQGISSNLKATSKNSGTFENTHLA